MEVVSEMSKLSLPILALSRTDGEQVLRGYKLTPDEQKLFKDSRRRPASC